MKFHFAPVQGHTDAPYRHFHKETYGNDITYYTPFIRLEHESIRPRDLKDFTSPLNSGSDTVPQIIFRDEGELKSLVSLIKETGTKRIDLNMGCPFPLQTGHRRGAATISNHELARAVVEEINRNRDIIFSVKMRLGLNDPDEWKVLLPYLNETNLLHIAVHPRVARQQYGGDLHLDKFEEILEQSKNPVVFNGEIKTPEDITKIMERYPEIDGIMIGRGLLGRPSLIAEAESGEEWPENQRIEKMLQFHRDLFSYYDDNLCGESQILSKIRPFWEYAEKEIGRKAWKSIKKATNVAKYNSSVAMILSE